MRILRDFCHDNRSCMIALLCLCAVPLFPEYVAPFLTIGAVIGAFADARKRGDTLRIGMIGKLFAVYIAYMAVGVLYSEHKLNSLSTVAMWVVAFCAYLALATLLVNRRRLHLFLCLFALSAGIVGLIATTQYVLRDLLNLSLPNQVWEWLDVRFYRHFPMNVDIHIATHRVAATFNNPNIMSEFLVMAIPLVALCGFYGYRTRLTLTARVCVVLALTGVAASFSRGAYLALVSILLLVFVTNLRKLPPLLLSLIAALALLPEVILSRFFSIGLTSDFSITQRFDAWDVAIQSILESPLFGTGPGISNFSEYAQAFGVTVPHAHNIVLQLLIEGGFVGLFLLGIIAIRLLHNSVECLSRSPKTHLFGVFFLGFSMAFLVYGMVDFPFLCPKLVITFFTVIGTADAVFSSYLGKRTVPLVKAIPKFTVTNQKQKTALK